MLQEGNSHGAVAEEDQTAAWLPPDMLQQGMLDAATPCVGTCMISAALPGRQPLYLNCQMVAGAILMLMHKPLGGGGGRGGCISVSKVKHGAGGDSPDSAAVQQLLHVVEGLEEELFSSEARRNDAEVGASTVLMLNMSSLL